MFPLFPFSLAPVNRGFRWELYWHFFSVAVKGWHTTDLNRNVGCALRTNPMIWCAMHTLQDNTPPKPI